MIENYLKIAFRNILKHRTLSLINILGLAIGLTAFLFIFAHITYEFSYDKFWDKSNDIYRVSYDRYQNGNLTLKSARTLRGMAPVLREQLPEIKGSTELFKDVVTVYNEKNQIQDIQMFVTDSTFSSVFKLDFKDKVAKNPLNDLYSSVISESTALTLFGTTDAVGKWFKVCQGWRFVVNGVYKDLPNKTHLPFDMLLSWKTYYFYFQNWNDTTGTEQIKNPSAQIINPKITSWEWGYNGYYTYILTQPNADARQIESKIANIAVQYTKNITQNDGQAKFHLQPLSSIHLDSNLEFEVKPNGDRKSIVAMAFIALIILIIAWINFINLTMVRAVEHTKSIGLQKVFGATRIQLITRFLIESLLMNIASVLIAFGLVFLLKNYFSHLLGTPIELNFGWLNYSIFGLLVMVGMIISGLYPALILSSYKPIDLFKGIQITSKHLSLSKILVIIQFAASIVLISGVIAVHKQINYMKTQELGVNIEQTLVTFSPPTMIGRPQRMSKLLTYKSLVKALPGVEEITTSSAVPGKEILWQKQNVRKIDDQPTANKTFAYTNIDQDYIKTFNLRLLAGRNFIDNGNIELQSVIINETAMKLLGISTRENAINTFILIGNQQYKIIGVLKDYHHESLKKEIKPILYFHGYEWMSDIGYYSIKLKSKDIKATVAQVKAIWEQIYTEDYFNYFFLDEAFNKQYNADQQFGTVFSIFTLLAIIISALGLFGLVLYSSKQRKKEVGVRKVNGASVGEIVFMLNKDFIKWVLIAFLIATPIAYYVLYKWLENFANKTQLSWWIFALSGLLSIIISVLTISYQSWQAAKNNPVEALRDE